MPSINEECSALYSSASQLHNYIFNIYYKEIMIILF